MNFAKNIVLGIRQFPIYPLHGVTNFIVIRIFGDSKGFDLKVLNDWVKMMPFKILEASINPPGTSYD